MHLFRRTIRKKTGYGEDERIGINWFNVVLLVAAVFFMCSLLTALLWPVFFGAEPDTVIVPYGGGDTTVPPQPTFTAGLPATVPVAVAPQITAVPSVAISANTAVYVNHLFNVDPGALSAEVSSVAFSADGVFLAAGSYDGTVRVWSVALMQQVFTFRSASNRINSIAFAPNGRTLAGGGQDNIVRLWDLGSGQETQLTGPNAAVRAVAFSPDGTRLAAASDDGVIYVWNVSSGVPVLEQFLGGLTSYATSVAFSPDGLRLAAGSEDDTIRVWDVQTGSTLMVLQGHTSTVTSITFSPDGALLVSASADKTLRLWNLASGTMVLQMQGHTENLNDVAYAPDGTLIASAGGGIEDNTVRLWNPVTGVELRAPLTHVGPVNSVAFSADGRYLAAGGATYVALWAVTGQGAAPAATAIPPAAGQGGLLSCTLTIRSAQANQRTGPGLTYAHTATLTSGQQVQATGWATADDGYTWWQLNDGTWVRGDAFIDADNPTVPQACLSLPAATGFAAPAVTAIPAVTAYPTADTTGGACILTVQSAQANQRTGPGLTYAHSATLNGGQQVQATGWATADDGYTWWQINDGTWVRGDAFISVAVPQVPAVCLQLPPATNVPTPPAGADNAGAAGGVCTLTVRQAQTTLRSGPAEAYALTGTLSAGQQVQANGWATAADGFTWWRLVDGAWMRGDAVLDAANTTIPAACLSLPLIADLPDAGMGAGATGADPTGGACILTVREVQATIYNGPGETYAQAGFLSQNQQVQADGYAVSADGFTWWRFNGITWARGDVFLDDANPDVPSACLALPLVGP